MAVQSLPIRLPSDKGRSLEMQVFLQQLAQVAAAHTQSGTTAEQPAQNLFTGQPFFNTELNTPVTWNGSEWVAATNANLFTAYSFLYGNATGSISSTAAATNGQLLIGSTGNVPVAANIIQLAGITINNGPGSISIANSGVLSLQGTTKQIDVSSPTGNVVISIDAGYIGQSSITTVGTLTTGTWNATPIANAYLANSTITVSNGTGIGISGSPVSLGGTLTISNTGVTSNVAGSGISVSAATGAVTIGNTGVLSNIAGTGISVSGATGNVTVTNTGVTSFTSNTGLSSNVSATGAVTVTNTGVTSIIAGTGISVSGATGAVTVSTTTSDFRAITATTSTTPYTEATLTGYKVLTVNASGGAFVVNLPTAASTTGFVYTVKKIDASINHITITANGADTIDGSATNVLIAQYSSVRICSDGTTWNVV